MQQPPSLTPMMPAAPGPMMQGMAPTQSNQPNLVAMLWRRKGLVLFFLLCGLAGGYAYFTQQPETYQAGATVEVYRHQPTTNSENVVENVVDLAPSVAFIQAEMTSDEVLKAPWKLAS